jgi:hypothetical protein
VAGERSWPPGENIGQFWKDFEADFDWMQMMSEREEMIRDVETNPEKGIETISVLIDRWKWYTKALAMSRTELLECWKKVKVKEKEIKETLNPTHGSYRSLTGMESANRSWKYGRRFRGNGSVSVSKSQMNGIEGNTAHIAGVLKWDAQAMILGQWDEDGPVCLLSSPQLRFFLPLLLRIPQL